MVYELNASKGRLCNGWGVALHAQAVIHDYTPTTYLLVETVFRGQQLQAGLCVLGSKERIGIFDGDRVDPAVLIGRPADLCAKRHTGKDFRSLDAESGNIGHILTVDLLGGDFGTDTVAVELATVLQGEGVQRVADVSLAKALLLAVIVEERTGLDTTENLHFYYSLQN